MPDSIRKGDWFQTYSGRQFWPCDPKPEEIYLVDIAHALSNQCRFAGHCQRFYSVAQHSVIVSEQVPFEHAVWGLLHDAAEAYLVDLPRPIKRHSVLGREYNLLEEQLQTCIAWRFGLQDTPEIPACVHVADDRVLMTEKRDLLDGAHGHKWSETAEPYELRIVECSPFDAETLFLERARELGITEH